MDDRNIEELLSEEIAKQIQALSGFEAGSKEKSAAIDDLVQLYKLRIEENKWMIQSQMVTNKNMRTVKFEYNFGDDEETIIHVSMVTLSGLFLMIHILKSLEQTMRTVCLAAMALIKLVTIVHISTMESL